MVVVSPPGVVGLDLLRKGFSFDAIIVWIGVFIVEDLDVLAGWVFPWFSRCFFVVLVLCLVVV